MLWTAEPRRLNGDGSEPTFIVSHEQNEGKTLASCLLASGSGDSSGVWGKPRGPFKAVRFTCSMERTTQGGEEQAARFALSFPKFVQAVASARAASQVWPEPILEIG